MQINLGQINDVITETRELVKHSLSYVNTGLIFLLKTQHMHILSEAMATMWACLIYYKYILHIICVTEAIIF